MSEFDAFESAEAPQTEEDPAADFLAREQDQLAELEDNNFGVSGVQDGGINEQEIDNVVMNEFDTMLGGYEAVPDGNTFPLDEAANGNTEGALFLGGDIGGETNTDDLGVQNNEEQDVYAEVTRIDQERQEPEKIRLWREQQVEVLAKKDADAETKKGEWRQAARQELEDWYKHRAEQHEKCKKINREGEVEFLKERDEVTPGHEWERICRHCDFSPKGSRNLKDVSRMRSILLQLKQSPLVR